MLAKAGFCEHLNGQLSINHLALVISSGVQKKPATQERSKTINKYSVDDRPMEAFGTNKVPDSVSRLFNITNLNFQTQQEVPHGEGPLFWFALTPGQVSKRLNQIVNLDLIDRILTNLKSESRSAKSVLDVCRDRRKNARQRVKNLAFIGQMKKEWSTICVLNKKVDKYEAQAESLKTLLDEIAVQQSTVSTMKDSAKEMEQELQELESLHTTIIDIDEQIYGLSSALTKLKYAEQHLMESKNKLKMAEHEYKKAFGKRCPLCLKRK